MLIAVTRAVSPTLADCELTHRRREPIDVARATAEHSQYEQALHELGASVIRAAPAPALPDAVFVEDTAIVVDEVAVMTRPGAPSRRHETDSVAQVLSRYRDLARIEAPGTLDGGDVMRVGRRLYVGISSRSNEEAVAQLGALLRRWDYEVTPIEVTGCLHLKSAVTQPAEGVLLINPDWVHEDAFASMDRITVAPAEPEGANALRVGQGVIYPAEFPATAERLERAGLRVVSVPCAEVGKAEGAVTCCSIVFDADGT
jgi:dimethylargininase